MIEQTVQLCERARAGDRAAASELIDLHYRRIFSYFRRLCGNDEDAQDLTQKTFLKVWSALGSFQGRSSFSTWIHAIGYYVYVDWRRRRHHSQPQTEAWWENCVAEGSSPFEDAAERDSAHQLHTLVGQLEDGLKQVIHLHYYQGLSLQETAEVLNIATSTVKYRLRDALDFLRARTMGTKARL